jgi:hypothetical protein
MAKKKASVKPPRLPTRPNPQNRWPSDAPLPSFWPQDTGRLLGLILNRLDAIEERLARIEKILKKPAGQE